MSETQGATAQVDADIDLYSGVGEPAGLFGVTERATVSPAVVYADACISLVVHGAVNDPKLSCALLCWIALSRLPAPSTRSSCNKPVAHSCSKEAAISASPCKSKCSDTTLAYAGRTLLSLADVPDACLPACTVLLEVVTVHIGVRVYAVHC